MSGRWEVNISHIILFLLPLPLRAWIFLLAGLLLARVGGSHPKFDTTETAKLNRFWNISSPFFFCFPRRPNQGRLQQDRVLSLHTQSIRLFHRSKTHTRGTASLLEGTFLHLQHRVSVHLPDCRSTHREREKEAGPPFCDPRGHKSRALSRVRAARFFAAAASRPSVYYDFRRLEAQTTKAATRGTRQTDFPGGRPTIRHCHKKCLYSSVTPQQKSFSGESLRFCSSPLLPRFEQETHLKKFFPFEKRRERASGGILLSYSFLLSSSRYQTTLCVRTSLSLSSSLLRP